MKSLMLTFAGLLLAVNIFSQTGWSLTGNAGTTDNNFVGTTDSRPLIIKVNNQCAGYTGYGGNYNVSFGYRSFNPLSAGWDNTALGSQTLTYNTTGIRNVAVGSYALDFNTTGQDNVAIGESASARQNGAVSYTVAIGQAALMSNQTSRNTAVGYQAGVNNTTGEAFTALGFKALCANSTGNNNTALGFNALMNNTTGFNNTAVGAWTLVANTTGKHNTTIGMKSLFANTTGEYNTAIGVQTLELNTTGYWNVGLGSGALNQNVTGALNTAAGTSAMWNNKTGNENSAFGQEALAGSLDGNNNTAVGTRAMWSTFNTSAGGEAFGHANNNSAVGYEALREISTGGWNVGVGMHALRVNSSGSDNVAIGGQSLMTATSANGNVAVGRSALYNNTTGSYNTAIGYGADVKDGNLTNATAIGYGAIATANNQVMIGNSNVTSIRSYASLTTISDARIKKDVQTNIPGLVFINQLQPVSYRLDYNAMQQLLNTSGDPKDDKAITGFIAQDVEKAAKSVGFDFSGIDIDDTGNHLYGLRYSKFVVPLVKAVQELSEQNDSNCAVIASLQNQVETLTELVNKLLVDHNYSSVNNVVSSSEAVLGQNYPNPSNQSTTIVYTLPQVFYSAKIAVIDASGKILKQIPISGQGESSITIETRSLPAGTYFYSLCVDNTLMSTKKMIVSKTKN